MINKYVDYVTLGIFDGFKYNTYSGFDDIKIDMLD
jgi:hypothetical protein